MDHLKDRLWSSILNRGPSPESGLAQAQRT